MHYDKAKVIEHSLTADIYKYFIFDYCLLYPGPLTGILFGGILKRKGLRLLWVVYNKLFHNFLWSGISGNCLFPGPPESGPGYDIPPVPALKSLDYILQSKSIPLFL